jgi:hypothetical protein
MTQVAPFTPLDGGCRCGQARFRLTGEPIIVHACHCTLCQKTTGGPFRAVAMIETGRVALTEGRTARFQGASRHTQVQCPDCGSTLWTFRPDLGEAIAFVGLGMLDDGGRLAPEVHYFVRSRQAWVSLPEGVLAFDEIGDPGKSGARERILAALATAQA